MSTSAIMKKRVSVFLISLVLIIIILIVTYFIFGKNGIGGYVLINNKNIKVTFENSKKGIQFGANPMSFEQGLESSPSNIYKIVNKSEQKIKYHVFIKENSQGNNNIDINKLVVGINDEMVKSLKDIGDGVIYEGELEPKHESILNLKFWLDDELANSNDKGKTLSIKVNIKEK